MSNCGLNFCSKIFDNFVTAILGVLGADFGCDSEAGRHRHAEKVHFGEVRAFAAEEIAHGGIAFCFAVSKCINSFHSVN